MILNPGQGHLGEGKANTKQIRLQILTPQGAQFRDLEPKVSPVT